MSSGVEEGNSPDYRLRSQNSMLSGIKEVEVALNNQEVGLEAATL
jgi:hypothetical protein